MDEEVGNEIGVDVFDRRKRPADAFCELLGAGSGGGW
jgi:hypothetical protein